MRALACGDNHIGAGRDLAPDRLDEQERVWRETLSLSRQERCDAVLHGGDLWEHRKPDPACYLAAERPLVEHRAAGGPPVLMIAGNHDRSGVDDNLALSVLAQAGLITLSTEPEGFNAVDGELVRDLAVPAGVAVCTLPWTPVSRLVAAEDGGDRDRIFEDAADLLVRTAQGLRAQVDGPAVLLLHWSVSGASLPSGIPIEMAREVILPLGELEALGFDAIVCAHIHRQQHLATNPAEPEMPIFFVGSPMPLSFGEGGQEHGVWLLSTHEIGTRGAVGFAPEFRPLESRGFVTIEANGLIPDPLPAFVKVRGPQGADVAALREQLLAAGAERVWFDLEPVRTTRQRGEEITPELTEIEAFGRYLAANDVNGTVGDALVERAGKYLDEVRS